jgi:hypothetical protein
MLRRCARLTTTFLIAAAVAAPAALAVPDYRTSGGTVDRSVDTRPTAPTSIVPREPVRVAGPTVVVEADSSSFQWGDAAIGAAILAGLLTLGAAATTLARHRGFHARPMH